MRKEQTIPFVNLHGHSCFSVFDGLGYPQDHMDFAYSNGSDALALTDHGNMNGLSYQVLHAKKMRAEGRNFKPIYGIEAYFVKSLSEWRKVYNNLQESKKKGRGTQSAATVEDEGATKSGEKDFIKRRLKDRSTGDLLQEIWECEKELKMYKDL